MEVDMFREALSDGRQAKVRIDGDLFYLVPADELVQHDLRIIEIDPDEYPVTIFRRPLAGFVMKPSNKPAYTQLANNRWSGRK